MGGQRRTLPSSRSPTLDAEMPDLLMFDRLPGQNFAPKNVLAAAYDGLLHLAPPPFCGVTFEIADESGSGRVGKFPLLQRRYKFVPAKPIHKSTPKVPMEWQRNVKEELPVDVNVFVDKGGKVKYAELRSDLTAANRNFASLAVFDARRWEFDPARKAGHPVPAEFILHYRFGPRSPGASDGESDLSRAGLTTGAPLSGR
jgi:hypothetical protein